MSNNEMRFSNSLRQKLIKDCTPQELVAALMLQAKCDAFNPEQVLADLYRYPQLWQSFWMGTMLPLNSQPPLPLSLIMLRDLQEFWHTDTLYVLAQNPMSITPLQELGEQWNCDTVQVIDGEKAQALLGLYHDTPPIAVFWWD
ncbi:MAG: hypothetical protein RLP02_10675 [Coleofasciculus sp. C2-GNP5-27]|uniref:hypothetical protein n=1 Tax=Coleofasciculus sp. B1-GNL1-01 TaxID=3068484 RepID=UPI0032F11BC1